MRVCVNTDCPHMGVMQAERYFRRKASNGQCRTCMQRNEPPRPIIEPVDGEAGGHIRIGPWRNWIREQLTHHEPQDLARLLNTSERRVWSWAYEATRLQLDVLDAAICAWGDPTLLRVLYPYLYVECDYCYGVGTHRDNCPAPAVRRGANGRVLRQQEAA